MLELADFWRILDEGSTPGIVLIAYFIWKVERRLHEFITIYEAKEKGRDEKIAELHDDVKFVIKEMAVIQAANDSAPRRQRSHRG